MLKTVPFANAVTTVATGAFTLCGLLAFVAPDLFWGIISIIFHAINLDPVKATTPMSFGTVIFGVIAFTIYIWVVTYLAASLYNKWAK